MSKITYFTRSTKKGDHEVSIWIRIHHQSIKSPNNPTMSQYIYSKIMAMETKRFLNKGEPYSQNAMDNWKKFLNIWSSFEVSYSNQCIYPDDVNMQTYYYPYWYIDGLGGFGTKYPCFLSLPGGPALESWL